MFLLYKTPYTKARSSYKNIHSTRICAIETLTMSGIEIWLNDNSCTGYAMYRKAELGLTGLQKVLEHIFLQKEGPYNGINLNMKPNSW